MVPKYHKIYSRILYSSSSQQRQVFKTWSNTYMITQLLTILGLLIPQICLKVWWLSKGDFIMWFVDEVILHGKRFLRISLATSFSYYGEFFLFVDYFIIATYYLTCFLIFTTILWRRQNVAALETTWADSDFHVLSWKQRLCSVPFLLSPCVVDRIQAAGKDSCLIFLRCSSCLPPVPWENWKWGWAFLATLILPPW